MEGFADWTDHYEVLQLPPFSSMADVKRVYRQLALQTHPDKVGDESVAETERFMRATESYQYLLRNKVVYDTLLNRMMAGTLPGKVI